MNVNECLSSDCRVVVDILTTLFLLACDQAPLYFRGGKVRLIQLLDYLSVASPDSRLYSDWSRNKRYLELSPNWFPVCQSQ